jgi:hypothetical protein
VRAQFYCYGSVVAFAIAALEVPLSVKFRFSTTWALGQGAANDDDAKRSIQFLRTTYDKQNQKCIILKGVLRTDDREIRRMVGVGRFGGSDTVTHN